MNVGMLWFDNDARTSLKVKVERAADYYRRKYGLVPTLCMVHPSMLTGPDPDFVQARAGRLRLRTNRAILPGHFWIGVEDSN